MDGCAEFKSHVQRREEKGAFGIPFKRLLACGLGAGALVTLVKLALPAWSLYIGLVAFGGLLYLTAPQGGLARWQGLVYEARWALVTAAVLRPQSTLGQLGLALPLPLDCFEVDSALVFQAADPLVIYTEATDWLPLAHFRDRREPVLAVVGRAG